MPRINPDDYTPRENEPALMTTDQRAAASLAYHKELAEKGLGRVIVFGDGSAWFVPADVGEAAKDVATVLGQKPDSLAAFVIAEAFRVVADTVMGQMPKAVEAAPVDAQPAPAPAEAPAPSTAGFERAIGAIAASVAEQGKLLREIVARSAEPAAPPAPAAPVEGVAENIIGRLEDAGFTLIDHNKPGVTRGPMPFVNLYNGVEVQGKEPVIPLPTPQQAVEATLEGIHRYAESVGTRRLVWRTWPELRSHESGGYFIRCRLLAQAVAA